jgi:hypothetical protein
MRLNDEAYRRHLIRPGTRGDLLGLDWPRAAASRRHEAII